MRSITELINNITNWTAAQRNNIPVQLYCFFVFILLFNQIELNLFNYTCIRTNLLFCFMTRFFLCVFCFLWCAIQTCSARDCPRNMRKSIWKVIKIYKKHTVSGTDNLRLPIKSFFVFFQFFSATVFQRFKVKYVPLPPTSIIRQPNPIFFFFRGLYNIPP